MIRLSDDFYFLILILSKRTAFVKINASLAVFQTANHIAGHKDMDYNQKITGSNQNPTLTQIGKSTEGEKIRCFFLSMEMI